MERERKREPLSDDDMLFDLESELPHAGAPANDVKMAANDTPIEISSKISSPPESEEDEAPGNQRRTPPRRRNTFPLGRDAEVRRGQVMALRSQSLASLGDDHGNEVHAQIQNEIRSQEARNNVDHDDVWEQLGSLNIADDDAEHSSAGDEGNQGDGEDEGNEGDGEDSPRRVRGDSAGGGFRPCRMLKSNLAARPDFLQWNVPEVVSLLSSSDLEDLRTEDSAMSTYSE